MFIAICEAQTGSGRSTRYDDALVVLLYPYLCTTTGSENRLAMISHDDAPLSNSPCNLLIVSQFLPHTR